MGSPDTSSAVIGSNKMKKLALVALFSLTMATLVFAASGVPAPGAAESLVQPVLVAEAALV